VSVKMKVATEIRQSIQRMVCIKCGAEANASCNCGENYVPKSVRVAEAVKANPEKSNMEIAREVGADEKEVRRQRAKLSSDMSEDKRTGRAAPRKTGDKVMDDAVFKLHRCSYNLISPADMITDLLEDGRKIDSSIRQECLAVVEHTIDSLTRLKHQLRTDAEVTH
jgi:putative ubiquitin-RnfH superfamily antitoxin RatB of RatAB toxin-antitoxin module